MTNTSTFQLPLHGLRSRFLNWGFEQAYPLYRRVWWRHRPAWQYTRQQLQQLPLSTLGYCIGCFLHRNQIDLLPGFESHDVFHVLLDYDSTAVSETALQWHLLGNGKRSPFCLLAAGIGWLVFPEHWAYFLAARRRGQQQRAFHHWYFEYLLTEPLADLRAFIQAATPAPSSHF